MARYLEVLLEFQVAQMLGEDETARLAQTDVGLSEKTFI